MGIIELITGVIKAFLEIFKLTKPTTQGKILDIRKELLEQRKDEEEGGRPKW